MLRSRSTLTLLFLMTASACANDALPDPDEILLATPARVLAGARLPVILANLTGEDISVGALPCFAAMEREVGGRWEPVMRHSLDGLPVNCPLYAKIIQTGDALAFEDTAPALAGRYRILVSVTFDRSSADRYGRSISSAAFEVTAP